ncbi:hypothetical protein LSAT2_018129 [Lamellibrachia satsuma]|nr:hypothetical protein LSAT2_018129 [Lamellibrachia satsuma]
MKRTNSLDTIASSWYLKCEWPGLTSEKATQTEEDWEVSTERRKRVSHKRSSSLGNGDNSKELQKIKARLAKTTKEGSRTGVVVAPRASPVPASHLAIISNPVTTTTLHRSKALPVPHIPKPATRVIGSVEGLNQEIEKLVLSTTSATGDEEIGSTRTQEPTPDGHRAPILELLQGGSTSGSSSGTRTVVTQTPSGSNSGAPDGGGDSVGLSDMRTMLVRVTVDSSESNSSSRSQSESPSFPIIPGQMDNSRPSSSRSESRESKEDRTEKDCDSLLFVREPPDGCDKVIVEEPRMALECDPFVFCPIKPEKCHIPSNESAFRTCPLYDKYVTQSMEMALKASSSGKPGSSPPALEIQ